jgi:hypothetical protein
VPLLDDCGTHIPNTIARPVTRLATEAFLTNISWMMGTDNEGALFKGKQDQKVRLSLEWVQFFLALREMADLPL